MGAGEPFSTNGLTKTAFVAVTPTAAFRFPSYKAKGKMFYTVVSNKKYNISDSKGSSGNSFTLGHKLFRSLGIKKDICLLSVLITLNVTSEYRCLKMFKPWLSNLLAC